MTRVAAVDCGTNTTRLLVADVRDGVVNDIDRVSRITGLGRGVDATGSLDQAAMQRTLDMLSEYRESISSHGVEAVVGVATSAVRDAANGQDFLDRASETLDHEIVVLSGEAEAETAFAGATSWLSVTEGYVLVLDIGGGSTELILGRPGSPPEELRSIDVGAVRLTERYLHSDPPTPEELHLAITAVRGAFENLVREIPRLEKIRTLVGVAGTITTAAAIEIGLQEYDRDMIHGFRLTRQAAEDVFRTMATEKLEDRVHNPGLDPARADVIVGGMVVLVSLLRVLDLDECRVSERDLLDGLVLRAV